MHDPEVQVSILDPKPKDVKDMVYNWEKFEQRLDMGE